MTHDHDPDVAFVGQQPRRTDERLEGVRRAQCSDKPQIERVASHGARDLRWRRARRRRKSLGARTIWDHRQPIPGHSPRLEVVAGGRQQGDHRIGDPARVPLEPAQQEHQRMPARDGTELLERQRPEVTDLEHEPGAIPPGPPLGGEDRKRRRRRHDNRIRCGQPAHGQSIQARHERQHVDDPRDADRPTIGGHLDPAVSNGTQRFERVGRVGLRRLREQVREGPRDDDDRVSPCGERLSQLVVAELHAVVGRAGVLVDEPDDKWSTRRLTVARVVRIGPACRGAGAG